MTSAIIRGKEGEGAAMVAGGGERSHGKHLGWRLDIIIVRECFRSAGSAEACP